MVSTPGWSCGARDVVSSLFHVSRQYAVATFARRTSPYAMTTVRGHVPPLVRKRAGPMCNACMPRTNCGLRGPSTPQRHSMGNRGTGATTHPPANRVLETALSASYIRSRAAACTCPYFDYYQATAVRLSKSSCHRQTSARTTSQTGRNVAADGLTSVPWRTAL